MRKPSLVQAMRRKYRLLRPSLTERTRRQWAASEVLSMGWGGLTVVVAATHLAPNTIRAGIRELQTQQHGETTPLPPERVRRAGGGRKQLTERDPTLLRALNQLVEPTARGDPESPLRWTCQSTPKLAAALRRQGHAVSQRTVCTLLHAQGYSLQANRKTQEGRTHPDRDAQFRYLNETVRVAQRRHQPVISVDTKKKELVGPFAQAGREWRPKGRPLEVSLHDFADPRLGKVMPYGVYDLTRNEGWVSVGVDHDTAAFAVEAIRRWWRRMGKRRYHGAKALVITADCGGSNGNRTRLWKVELQQLADALRMTLHVRHFPPGTSKWNKIEHRMFSFMTQNWRGRPLVSRAAVVQLIASTRTQTGLRIAATVDAARYETGRKIAEGTMRALALHAESFHGEWNDRIQPR